MRLAIVLLAMPLLAADLTLSSPDGRVQLQLSFQGKSRMESHYRATMIRDTGEAAAVKIENVTVAGTDSLYVNLRSGGGFVGQFVR